MGLATAAHLSRAGLSVSVHDIDPNLVAPLRASGCIEVRGHPEIEGRVPVSLATTDLAEALDGVGFVVSAVPASAHEALARAAAQLLESETLLLIQPGQTLSAAAFLFAARGAGCRADITPVETLNTLFTGRLLAPGCVAVLGVKRTVRYAAWPASRTVEVSRRLEPLFPALTRCSSVLEVGMHNANAVMHPPISLLNLGRIDAGESFRFYVDGGGPHIMRLVESVERERLRILDRLKLPTRTLLQWYEEAYGERFDDLYQVVRRLPAYQTITGPKSVRTRLLLEDVPTGLVPWCSIADVAAVEVPVMRALVELCCALYSRNFWAEGRTLERLGLPHRDLDAILEDIGPSEM